MMGKRASRISGLLAACLVMLVVMLAAGCGTQAGGDGATVAPTSSTGAVTTAETATTPYSFAVCGDNRLRGIENGVLGRVIDSARARGAAFMVDTGDVTTSGTEDELIRYLDFTGKSGLKFHTVPGNHDVGEGGTSEAYESIIGPPYYSFDYAGDHFVIVDNADDETGIPPEEMRWLTADLAANAERRNQFIFAHIPVASASLPSGHATGEGGDAGLQSGKALTAEAARYPNIQEIFFGHIHAYMSYRLDGINAYVTGGAGAPLTFPEEQGGYYHYLLVSVKGDSVEVEVVRV